MEYESNWRLKQLVSLKPSTMVVSDIRPQGDAMGLCSCDGGVGNIFDSSSGLRLPSPDFCLELVEILVMSSSALEGLLDPGGVGA